MRKVVYDAEKHEQEKIDNEQKERENADRVAFFERMNKNRKFQKYIIEEILDQTIEQANSLNEDMEKIIASQPEEAQRLMIAKSASLKTARSIKNRMTVNF